MAVGRRHRHPQQTMWLATDELPRTAGHVFYDRVNKVLAERSIDYMKTSELRMRFRSRREAQEGDIHAVR